MTEVLDLADMVEPFLIESKGAMKQRGNEVTRRWPLPSPVFTKD